MRGLSSGPTGIIVMSNAINAYCEKHNLASEVDRQAVALRVIGIYSRGVASKDAILDELARQDGPTQTGDQHGSAPPDVRVH